MLEDKARWNKKYETAPMPSDPIEALTSHIGHITAGGKALDIACGMGRHTNYLASLGIYVDAVDYSDVALSKLDKSDCINPIDTDLDHFMIDKASYDLIVCTNFLSRRLFPFMKEGLKKNGVLVFETFVELETPNSHKTSNIEYHLRNNELLHAFIGLEVLFYREQQKINLRGEDVKVATLVAKRV